MGKQVMHGKIDRLLVYATMRTLAQEAGRLAREIRDAAEGITCADCMSQLRVLGTGCADAALDLDRAMKQADEMAGEAQRRKAQEEAN